MPFQAPRGTPVYWGEAELRNLKNPTFLNPDIHWKNNADGEGFAGRYAEGDESQERKGSFIISVGVHGGRGNDYQEVKAWKTEHGETEEPNDEELYDWAIVHRGNNLPPIDAPDGTRANPFPVRGTKENHGRKRQVDGVWYMFDVKDQSLPELPKSTKPPTPQPPPPIQPPSPPSPPTSGRTINVDFNCTVQKPSHSIDLPPNTTRLDGDLLIVVSEDPRQALLRHFTDPETGVSALNVGNVRVSFFALRGNNTGSEKKPKRKLRWGFTQGAQLQARAEGDIVSKDGAKDGQLAGPRLALPGVHRIRFTHLAATGVTTFTFSDNTKMKVTSKETGVLNSAKFWLGTNLPADLGDTSYIPPIGRITGSLTINGSGEGAGTGAPPITPTPPTPQPQPVTNLIEFVRDLNARARDLSNQTQALLNMVEKP